MDSMEVNKGIAAVLTAGIAFMVCGIVAANVISPKRLEKSVLKIAGVSETTGGEAAKPTGPQPIAPLLAKADVKKGEQEAGQICAACHTFKKGGPNGIGPDLWNVVDRKQASEPGYDYSSALKSKAKGNWTYDQLNHWLYDPQTYAPGTKMSFTGFKNGMQRADVIAYLRTLSDNPKPLPKVTPAMEKAAQPKQAAAAPQKPSGPPSAVPLLATANVQEGQTIVSQVCAACHTDKKGAPNGLGPNLYGVVGRKQATEPGFDYSSALKSKAKGDWTYAQLSDWLYDPQKYAPGTKMTFTGLKSAKQRADVIAYLRTLSPHPEPLPQAAPAKAAAPAQPAAQAKPSPQTPAAAQGSTAQPSPAGSPPKPAAPAKPAQ